VLGMAASAAAEAVVFGVLSSGASSSSSNGIRRLEPKATVMAATAAGAYAAHIGMPEAQTAPSTKAEAPATDATSKHANGAALPCGSSSSSRSNSSLPADTGVACSSSAGTAQGLSHCPEGCDACTQAAITLCFLRCLEQGTAMPNASAAAVYATLAESVKQRGADVQQHVLQQLLALAWRHPVRGVCGNVLCGRLEGPAAVGVLTNGMGTVCGRCRAAWYCCEECQQAAWAAHRAVCRSGT
jgi:hypothetical protein